MRGYRNQVHGTCNRKRCAHAVRNGVRKSVTQVFVLRHTLMIDPYYRLRSGEIQRSLVPDDEASRLARTRCMIPR